MWLSKLLNVVVVECIVCQELDCSGLLGVRKTVVLWVNESVVQDCGSEESAKLKLDR